MSTGIDPYAVLAKYYDGAYAAMKDLIDVRFYVDLAKRIGGPVLEIGCGTGRVLLPIARAGITIHGLDSSLAMLGILRQKIDREPPEVRERIRTHNGDMRNFRLEKKYPLVIIPFRPMQHMHSGRGADSRPHHRRISSTGKRDFSFRRLLPKIRDAAGTTRRRNPGDRVAGSFCPELHRSALLPKRCRPQNPPDLYGYVSSPNLRGRRPNS